MWSLLTRWFFSTWCPKVNGVTLAWCVEATEFPLWLCFLHLHCFFLFFDTWILVEIHSPSEEERVLSCIGEEREESWWGCTSHGILEGEVLVQIMLIGTIRGGSKGDEGKMPIRDESLNKPTPIILGFVE